MSNVKVRDVKMSQVMKSELSKWEWKVKISAKGKKGERKIQRHFESLREKVR